jgi:NADH:ubiquinone oxidoreductase subunit 4 (subunit M)
MPLFGMNDGLASGTLGIASLAGLIHIGLKARSEKDLKHLFALLSSAMISLSGIALSFHNSDGIRAAWLMMLSQGLAIPCGLLLTQSLESRWGTRDVTRLGDLVATSPRLAMMLGTLLLGWTSVPLLAGFSAMHQQLAGASSAGIWLILGESLGVVLLATTGLRVFAEVMTPTSRNKSATTPAQPFRDLSTSEVAIQLPMIALLVAVNVAPMLFVQACDRLIPESQQISRHP